ncbi:MAG: HDOD domain-containing protein [Myxococcaceae bacterium]|nr:HDOD domain-containing protein [Myxococcaceae bacterium]MCA3016030.1 HDOD domain-containing protein [Myxococcaceae bacterium]
MDAEAAIRQRVAQRRLKVPPAPTTCVQLSNLLGQTDWSMAELERLVHSDQGIAGAVLRMANGVGVRGREPVTALPVAIGRIGARGVVKLAWAQQAAASTGAKGPLQALRLRAWREALVAAHVAQWQSGPGKLSPLAADVAFVVGLLHDIGRLVVLSSLEEILLAHADADTRTDAGWWALVEDLHVMAGVALVDAWRLPQPLASAVAKHHEFGDWEWLSVVDEVVAQVETFSHLTPELLGSIAALDTAACEQLAAELPGLVTALRMVDPSLPEPEAASPFEAGMVRVSTGTEVVETLLQRVDELGLIIAVDPRLSTSLVVYVRCEELGCYARVERVEGRRVRLRPWALSVTEAAAWERFRAQLAEPAT